MFPCFPVPRFQSPLQRKYTFTHNLLLDTTMEHSGVGGYEGSIGVRAISSSAAVWPPPTTPYMKKKSHRIFTFQMDPTGQFRGGVRTSGPPWPATPLIGTEHTLALAQVNYTTLYSKFVHRNVHTNIKQFVGLPHRPACNLPTTTAICRARRTL